MMNTLSVAENLVNLAVRPVFIPAILAQSDQIHTWQTLMPTCLEGQSEIISFMKTLNHPGYGYPESHGHWTSSCPRKVETFRYSSK